MEVSTWLFAVALLLVYCYFRFRRTFEISGRAILVTGGGSGIGQGLCVHLAERGAACIIIWDLRQNLMDETADKVRAVSGGKCRVLTYVVDVSNHVVVSETAARVSVDLDVPVSVVINNAGIVIGKRYLELTPQAIQRTINVNCVAHFFINQAFLPDMLKRDDGMIVTIASIAGTTGCAGLTDYVASKFGALGAHDALRQELNVMGSHVNMLAVCPFFIDTGMFSGAYTGDGRNLVQRLFFPLLKPSHVWQRIVLAMERRERMLMMPHALRYTSFIQRCLPIAIGDTLANVIGANKSMAEFKGRGEAWAMASQPKKTE